MESVVHSTRDYAKKKIVCLSFPPFFHSLSTKTKLFFYEHFFCSFQMKETNTNNQQVVKKDWKYSLQNVRRIDLHLGLGEPNRFVFGPRPGVVWITQFPHFFFFEFTRHGREGCFIDSVRSNLEVLCQCHF